MKHIRSATLGILVAACVACGGTASSTEVAYIGETLVISGKEYRPDPSVSDFGPGLIIVIAREGKSEELESWLASYALNITWRGSAVPAFAVEVSPGFETQWVTALRELGSVEAADVNKRFYPASAK